MIFDGNQQKSFKTNDLIDFLMKMMPKPLYYNDFIDFFDENQAKSHYIIMTLLTLYVPGTLVLT